MLPFLLLTGMAVNIAEVRGDIDVGVPGSSTTPPAFPTLPLQFSGIVLMTANLINEDEEYPPRLRKLRVDYDFVAGKVKSTVLTGYHAGRTYIRRYDIKKEYMIRDTGISPECRRAYLGEPMPEPGFLGDQRHFQFLGIETVGGGVCVGKPETETCVADHWAYDAGDSRVHLWAVRTATTSVPVRLRNEHLGPGGTAVSLMTYEFHGLRLSPPSRASFDIPSPHSHNSCERHIGGFPYIHAFDKYVLW